MTYRVRKVNDAVIHALVKAHNDERRVRLTAEVHYDISGAGVTGDVRDPTQNDLQSSAAAAADLPTVITLANELKRVYAQHGDDTHVHDATDGTNVIAAPDATDQTTANTLLNEIKADYNAHRSEAGVHPNNDAGNAVLAADASDLATSITLANEIQTDLNAHINAALTGQGVQLVAP